MVTIGVATYGSDWWRDLANTRAVPSAEAQDVPVIAYHGGDSIAEARNEVLARCNTEFIIYLDGDDELEPGYAAAMMRGSADVRGCQVRCMRDNNDIGLFMPYVWTHRRQHQCIGDCLPDGNWLLVSACARTQLLRDVGGWGDEPIYEDWALWLRCWKAGATFEALPDAIYRQHLRPDSRNHIGPAYEQRREWHERIVKSVLGDA